MRMNSPFFYPEVLMLLHSALRAQGAEKQPASFIGRISGAYLETGQARKLIFLYQPLPQPQRTSNSSALITCEEPESAQTHPVMLFLCYF